MWTAVQQRRGLRFDPSPSIEALARAYRSFHLTRELMAAGGNFDNTPRYVELHATFDADFHDLLGESPDAECLSPDCAIGYAAGQKLADEVRAAGGNGIVYPSVRCPGGTCPVAFWPGLVRDFQQGRIWVFVWAGQPEPTVACV